jgi:hypothetical protein
MPCCTAEPTAPLTGLERSVARAANPAFHDEENACERIAALTLFFGRYSLFQILNRVEADVLVGSLIENWVTAIEHTGQSPVYSWAVGHSLGLIVIQR